LIIDYCSTRIPAFRVADHFGTQYFFSAKIVAAVSVPGAAIVKGFLLCQHRPFCCSRQNGRRLLSYSGAGIRCLSPPPHA